MRYSSVVATAVLVACGWMFGLGSVSACGGNKSSAFGTGSNGMLGGGGDGDAGDLGNGMIPGIDGSAVHVCPKGLTCTASCPAGKTTTISGKVYDPAKTNPLYDISVYVPETALTALPRGVITGTDACECEGFYKSGAYVSTTTGVDGSFTLQDAPIGTNIPLVLQIGKWRRLVHVNTTQCQDNPQPDKSLAFLGTIPAGDTDDNLPDIAVSTGSADTLECLMLRIGLPTSEYVAGSSMSGHVHVFSGGATDGNYYGQAEQPAMPGAPPSPTSLWASQAQLMPYDITLLSCEGAETYNANPPALEAYLNAGGRVFASHYHYAWFSGPISSTQAYTAPPDWGPNLATWMADQTDPDAGIGGIIDTTLNGSTAPFPKGTALQKWLTNVNALGVNVLPGELSIYQPRYNALVSPLNKPSQPWITSDLTGQAGATMYFSFDTPVTQPPQGPDSNGPTYCGRAVFSDLHVGSDPTTSDEPPPPGGCDATHLSPQERALEFMIFDLSGCVIPDTQPPPTSGVPTAQ